jgi:hypothetical protein
MKSNGMSHLIKNFIVENCHLWQFLNSS